MTRIPSSTGHLLQSRAASHCHAGAPHLPAPPPPSPRERKGERQGQILRKQDKRDRQVWPALPTRPPLTLLLLDTLTGPLFLRRLVVFPPLARMLGGPDPPCCAFRPDSTGHSCHTPGRARLSQVFALGGAALGLSPADCFTRSSATHRNVRLHSRVHLIAGPSNRDHYRKALVWPRVIQLDSQNCGTQGRENRMPLVLPSRPRSTSLPGRRHGVPCRTLPRCCPGASGG